MRLERTVADHAATDRVRTTVANNAQLPAELAPEDAVAAVMCVLTERLTGGQAHALLEALPSTLRALFQFCAVHREGLPPMKLDRADFLHRVSEHLGVTPAHAELVCEVVFDAVRNELPDELVAHVAQQLPRGLHQLWLAKPRHAPPPETTLSDEDARRTIEEEIERATPLPPGVTSAEAFSAVMCAFSARLSGGEARDLELGLPPALGRLVHQCMTHRSEPADVFGRDALLRRVADHLDIDPSEVEAIVRATFAAVRRLLPEKAVLDVASQLPQDLLELWEHP